MRYYYVNKDSVSDVYLTTYHTLLNDYEEAIRLFNTKGINIFLVIDEAHYIKQICGQWAEAVLKLSRFAKYRCILTGTPMPRSYTDLFNQFDFLWPDENVFGDDGKTKISLFESKNEQEKIKEILDNTIKPLFFRVKKKDLGLLPQDFNPPVQIEMNKYEKVIYNAIVSKISNYSKKDYLINIDLVTRLRRGRIMRLRQCTSYVKMLANVIEGYDENLLEGETNLSKYIINYEEIEKPAKLVYLTKMINRFSINGDKVIIWSNFIKTIEMIKKEFKSNNLICEVIYGKTPIESRSTDDELNRETIIEKFLDIKSGLNILIANPAACAESISLHKSCFNAIYYDLSYNLAQYLQSLDRIHRVGGSEYNIAHYYFLQYHNTIDQDIKNNLEIKADRMRKIIDEDYSIYDLNMIDDEADNDVEAYTRLFKVT